MVKTPKTIFAFDWVFKKVNKRAVACPFRKKNVFAKLDMATSFKGNTTTNNHLFDFTKKKKKIRTIFKG